MDEVVFKKVPSATCSIAQQADLSKFTTQDNNPTVDINHVIELIKTLYYSKNPDEQNEANRELTELQSSTSAWHVCWPLLDPDLNQPPEVHFFAANLLVLKINQSWSQQDPEWLEQQLRPQLYETLVKYAASPNGTKLVIERLSLAMANFALHSIPKFWPNAIEELVQTLTNPNTSLNIPHQRICDILLKILTYIPEEYSVMLPSQNDRASLNGQISQAGPLVFKFLHTLLASKSSVSPESRQEILRCLTSWVMHSQTSLLELANGKILLDLIYELIDDDELCSSACTALAATFDSKKADNYRNSVIEYMPKMANLKPIIQKYLAADEIECVIKIYSLVINFCENHSKLMVKIVLEDNIPIDDSMKSIIKQSVFSLINIILDCTAAPGIFGIDEKYSEITFAFWFTFFEVFYYYADAYTDMVCDLFDPLVDSLVRILVKKAQYPPSVVYHQVWNDDQREEYRRYRHDLGDALSMIVQFPRAKDRILGKLHNQLAQELQLFIQSAQANNPLDELPWQSFESTISALKSIAEHIPFDEEKYMPRIFNLFAQIPFQDCQAAELYCSSTEMIAAYSDWLFSHTSYLPTAFKILFLGVTSSNSYIRLMSTLSLKDITKECQTVLQPYAEDIVKSCSEAIITHDNLLNTSEKARLMHTVGCAMAVASPSFISTSLVTLTAPLLEDLNLKCQQDSDVTSRSVILDRMNMLTGLIESLQVRQYSGNEYEDADENNLHLYDPNRCVSNLDMNADVGQPAVGLLQHMIPILDMLVKKYGDDEEIMNKVADVVRKSAKNLNIEIKPVLKDLMLLLVNAYNPLSNFNTIQDVVPLYNIFKVDPSVRDFLRDAFANITDKTLSCCLANPLHQLSVTVEVYFRVAHLICKKFFSFLSEQPCHINIDLIYKLALASLELPEKRTLTEVCNFLSMFRVKSLGEPHLETIFAQNIEQLIENIFKIFGGSYSTPRNATDTVIDMAFFVFDADEARGPLERIARRDNFPTSHVTNDEKARFISTLIQDVKRKNRRKFKDLCSDFVLRTRNLNRAV